MPDLEAQIKAWRAELARTGLAREVVDELEGHLRERLDRLIASGSPQAEAFQTAVQQLGDGRTLKSEFTKSKRWRIFRGNPPGINIMGAWLVVLGLNGVIMALCRFCIQFYDFIREVLQNYSFKGVEPRWLTAVDWNATVTAGIFILIGFGLLRRWKICQVAALWVALTQIYFNTFYYFTLGHPNPGVAAISHPANVVIHTMFLGVPLPYWFSYLRGYVGLVIFIWGVCSLLQLWLEKLLRRVAD